MSGQAPVRVAVLLTCFNRRDLTIRAIGGAIESATPLIEVEVTMVDDGSTDGTADAVHSKFPEVRILLGSGHLYWSGGMGLAQRTAMADKPDFLFWLNDDVELIPNALSHLVETSSKFADQAIIVGAVADATGQVTYAGYNRPGRRPQSLVEVLPGLSPIPIDTMNGNCVLIPRKVADVLGPVDDSFTHRFGDIDYGYRAKAAGIRVILASGTIGSCEANEAPSPHLASGLSLRRRLQIQTGPIYLPFKDQLRFSRRHAGSLWPLATLSPYVRTAVWHAKQRLKASGS